MKIQDQMNFCKQEMAKGKADFKYYRAILETLLLAEKHDLVPDEIAGHDYMRFFNDYYEWRCSRGAQPRMDGRAGKSLKDIIRYLLKNDKVKGDMAKAMQAWKYILTHWDYLSDFLKNQVALMQINKNIEEIIDQLTHASRKQKQQHNKSEKQRLKDAIKSRGK